MADKLVAREFECIADDCHANLKRSSQDWFEDLAWRADLEGFVLVRVPVSVSGSGPAQTGDLDTTFGGDDISKSPKSGSARKSTSFMLKMDLLMSRKLRAMLES